MKKWKQDDEIKAVVIRSVPSNAFCAGGDVRSLYHFRDDEFNQQMEFFWHEYRLNHFIHHFGKPYIALMDGVTMGGGVGVSMHGSHPIASERFIFAMPETSIGFFPDIGASYLLTRCPGYLGHYLGLTGNRLGPQDSIRAGLVRQIISSAEMSNFVNQLAQLDLSIDAHSQVDLRIQQFTMHNPPEEPSQIKSLITEYFAQATIEELLKALEHDSGAWATSVHNTLEKKSPLSLKVTLAQLQRAKGRSLDECLVMDYALVAHFMKANDFYEGVRALLIDKDKNPKWNPSRFDLISEAMVVNYFEQINGRLEFITV